MHLSLTDACPTHMRLTVMVPCCDLASKEHQLALVMPCRAVRGPVLYITVLNGVILAAAGNCLAEQLKSLAACTLLQCAHPSVILHLKHVLAC